MEPTYVASRTLDPDTDRVADAGLMSDPTDSTDITDITDVTDITEPLLINDAAARTDEFGELGELKGPPDSLAFADTGLVEVSTEHRRDGEPQSDRFGRYFLLEVLGSGGMAKVYAAYDPELDRKVAVKVLRSDRTDTGHGVRLLREATAMARLSHPNVVAVHDTGEIGGQGYIAIEYVSGQTLKTWLRDDRPWQDIIAMFVQAGRGLQAAHAAGFIHRDFKPSNVLVREDGHAKVTDFGMVRALDDGIYRSGDGEHHPAARARSKAFVDSITATGAIMGTPRYMAPEQLAGKAVDERSDQFSFCVSLYEGLYGKRPFRGNSNAELAQAVLDGAIEPPPADREVPKWLHELIVRGLHSDPDERWPSMAALLAKLDLSPVMRKPRRWHRWAALGGALVAACVLAFVLVWPERRASGRACDAASDKLDATWRNGETRRAVRTAVTGGDAGRATLTWQRLEATLDAYAARWQTAYDDACRAESSGDRDPVVELACLDQRLQTLNALVITLATDDAIATENILPAAIALPDVELCADPDVTVTPLPAQTDLHSRVADARAELARAEVLAALGAPDAARAIAGALADQVRAFEFTPLIAELDLWRGRLGGDRAERDLERAYYAARAAGHDHVAITAAILLAEILGAQSPRRGEAENWARHALADIERAGTATHRADALYQAGQLLASAGKLDLAIEQWKLALADLESTVGKHSPRLIRVLDTLGQALAKQGAFERAIAQHGRALSLRKRAFGDQHPRVAESLDRLGDVFYQQSKPSNALDYYREARALREQALGADHPLVTGTRDRLARALGALASAQSSKGEHASAVKHLTEALAAWEALHGADSPRLAPTLLARARAQLALNRPDQALADADRATRLREASQPIELAEARFVLAQALLASGGSRSRARSLARKARRALQGADRAGEVAEIDAWLRGD